MLLVVVSNTIFNTLSAQFHVFINSIVKFSTFFPVCLVPEEDGGYAGVPSSFVACVVPIKMLIRSSKTLGFFSVGRSLESQCRLVLST